MVMVTPKSSSHNYLQLTLRSQTKVPPYATSKMDTTKKERGHTKENLPKLFHESLASLKASKVDILYLHSPDHETSYEESLKAIDNLYREGLFDRVRRFGYDTVIKSDGDGDIAYIC